MSDIKALLPGTMADALKLVRTEKGLTLTQLAEKSGLSVSYLSDLERGRTMPSIKTLGKIAAALDHRLHLMMDEAGETMFPVRPEEAELLYALRQKNFERFMLMATSILVADININGGDQ